MLLLGAKCNTGNIFPISYIWQITAKYEKRGKYLPILHEETCNNHFIVKRMLVETKYGKSLYCVCLIQRNTNLVQTSRSKNLKY